jgi:hypothetical protein
VKTRFLTPARKELNQTIAYYNKQHEGLGFRLSDEVKITLQKLLSILKPVPNYRRLRVNAKSGVFPLA